MGERMAHRTGASGGAWAPFAHPAFRNLWLAQLGSNIGSWMQSVGAQWFLLEATHSSALVAWVQTASLLTRSAAVAGRGRSRRRRRSAAPADRAVGGIHGRRECPVGARGSGRARTVVAAAHDVRARMHRRAVEPGVAGDPARSRAARRDPGGRVAVGYHGQRRAGDRSRARGRAGQPRRSRVGVRAQRRFVRRRRRGAREMETGCHAPAPRARAVPAGGGRGHPLRAVSAGGAANTC
ncbi:hypothetical protein RKD05_000460 [Microbacterium sp. SLBN-111]